MSEKAIRALIPGFVNYYYNKETEQPPAHTKPTFTKLKIHTVYSIILKNIMMFMYRTTYLPYLLPTTISALFPADDLEPDNNLDALEPVADNIPDAISGRLTTQKNSLFIKGPRLYKEITVEAIIEHKLIPTSTLNSYKNAIKAYLTELQARGCDTEWVPENCRLCIQKATRSSQRVNHGST